jgi:drug/metabolite transporter (DMT)-like permease
MRAHPHLPIPLVIGVGALVAGVIGTLLTGPAAMPDGRIWPIVLTGAVVLPVSFFCLSLASRHTPASNVSLLMLLETVLAPMWVWLALGESMTPTMLAGGAVVVATVGAYVVHTGRSAAAARRLRP